MNKIYTTLVMILITLSAAARAEDACRENLRQKICVATIGLDKALESSLWETEPLAGMREYLRKTQEVPCTPASAQMAEDFVRAYDELPELPKKLLCRIRRVLVTADDPFGAAVMTVFDPESAKVTSAQPYEDRFISYSYQVKPMGTDLWINAERFTPIRSYESWLTEHLGFLFVPGQDEMPRYTLDQPQLSSLASTLIHEMGHVLQSANPGYTGWENFSFQTNADGRPTVRHPDSEIFKGFFEKTPSLKTADTGRVVDFLKSNAVVSIYAAASPPEDFAETFEFTYDSSAKMIYQGQTVWDGIELEKTDPVLAAKLKYVRQMATDPQAALTEAVLPPMSYELYLLKPQ